MYSWTDPRPRPTISPRPRLAISPPIDEGELAWAREQAAACRVDNAGLRLRIAQLERENAMLRNEISRLLAQREATRG